MSQHVRVNAMAEQQAASANEAELRAAIQAALALVKPQFGPPSKRAIAEAAAILQRVLAQRGC